MIPLQDVCWLLSPQTLGSCSWSNRASSTSSTSQDHSGDWSCYSERVRKWGEKYLKVEKLNVWGRLQGFHRSYLVVVEIQNLWRNYTWSPSGTVYTYRDVAAHGEVCDLGDSLVLAMEVGEPEQPGGILLAWVLWPQLFWQMKKVKWDIMWMWSVRDAKQILNSFLLLTLTKFLLTPSTTCSLSRIILSCNKKIKVCLI